MGKEIKYRTKEDLSAMALEAQKFLLEHNKKIDWATMGIKVLFNYTKSLMITIKRGRISMKKNRYLFDQSEWENVIESSLEILHACILQIHDYLQSGEAAAIDLPLSLTLMADYVKLCNDEEDLRYARDHQDFTTLDGETLQKTLDTYLS